MDKYIYGIELKNGSNYIIYSDFESIENLLIEIKKSEWIGFNVKQEWSVQYEKVILKHCMVKTSEIVTISW
jgi:hypothetical protein